MAGRVNVEGRGGGGKGGGLETACFTTQTAFLLAPGQGNEFADLYDEGQTEAERVRARLQLKTLIHPEGMGERFQVLVQRKGSVRRRRTGGAGFSWPDEGRIDDSASRSNVSRRHVRK